MSENDPGFFIWIGIKLPDLVAGFMGGVVNAFVRKRSDPLSILGSMVVGGLTANYLADPFSRFLGANTGVAGFVVGLAGMTIAQGILEAAKSWRPFGNVGNGNVPNSKGNGDVP